MIKYDTQIKLKERANDKWAFTDPTKSEQEALQDEITK